MAERPARRKPAAKPKKVAPRTKGTPAKPPAPRKVAKVTAPKSAQAPAVRKPPTPKPNAPKPLAPAARRPATPDAAAPAQMGWQPAAAPAPAWVPVPAPARPFDAASGDWLPVAGPAGEPAAVDPAAYNKGATRTILLNILLGITLGFAGLLLLAGLVVGIILVAAPDSDAGEYLREQVAGESTSPGYIIFNALLTFLMFGIIPFFWVLGTRVVPWLGTVKFLQLRVRLKDWLLGVALVPLMIASVWVLLVVYTCAVDGCGALTEEQVDDEAEEGPLDEMVANLTWPVVIIVSLCAGIGEEILFRGVLQRWLGIWGQGLAFGLAHAQNAYPPQVIFAFGLGVVFGYLYKRGWSLVTLMVAHTLYDFTLLSIAMLYPELG